MHGHNHDDTGPAPASRNVRVLLASIMSVLFVATLIALVALWPHADELPAPRPWLSPDAVEVAATVTAIDNSQAGQSLTVQLDDGGQAQVTVAPLETVEVGDRVRLVRTEVPANPNDPTSTTIVRYLFFEFERGVPMIILGLAFVLVVIGIARLKGFAAIIGLFGALAMVWYFTLPAILAGHDGLSVALTTASAVMFIVVYLAHGISVKTTTALLGTFFGVALVAVLALWATPATHLSPASQEEFMVLYTVSTKIDLRGVMLCGMVLAGVGVLNDVTITQASAVWELRSAAPQASRGAIFASAMRIGRDHIASTVYTIAFAYVGGALGLLALVSTLDHNVIDLLTFSDIAQELVPILVASIGLVVTIPLTTAIGAWLAAPNAVDSGESDGDALPEHSEHSEDTEDAQHSSHSEDTATRQLASVSVETHVEVREPEGTQPVSEPRHAEDVPIRAFGTRRARRQISG